jgi:hypothetical protein
LAADPGSRDGRQIGLLAALAAATAPTVTVANYTALRRENRDRETVRDARKLLLSYLGYCRSIRLSYRDTRGADDFRPSLPVTPLRCRVKGWPPVFATGGHRVA